MMKNNKNQARKHSSSKLQQMMSEISPLERKQVRTKMLIAAKIDDLIIERGWTKSQFAEKMGKLPSEISKWLSGTQNFTIDILSAIAHTFELELTELLNNDLVQKSNNQHFGVIATNIDVRFYPKPERFDKVMRVVQSTAAESQNASKYVA